ncbi:hypothetical protein ISF9_042 [Microbacterium phage vB_MoxS-ISF9]|uniref:Uncharacterized protein n=1 Tax=Microbacterium phage vB_MoxS-ISF9 TaxID=1458670 RepID=W8P091_9CAUD|nr:hypothetical protein ISF9_042 [Microbacterium phage vB_MoxS-ISF9]AHL18512.1 hypothetical protein ISF9_042 [Microbacterium phage vB_MoxS-ISF9]
MDEIEELGTRAAHWCMYWRDSGEHNYQQHWKRGQVCKGCGAEPPRPAAKKKEEK